jgi:DNA-binding MarR family transcriptional regulator
MCNTWKRIEDGDMSKPRDQTISRRAAAGMLHVALQMKSEIERRIQAETGLLLADNEALLNLVQRGKPLRMSTIAECLIISKGGTTKVIDRLEAKGLVERSQDPADRRALVVEITPKGRKVFAEIQPVVDDAIESYWGQHVTDDEAATILDVVNRVVESNIGWVD